MRIIVTGGGTGGHIFPALEIVKEIKRQNNKIEVIYVGNKNSLEEKMAKSAQVPFIGLSTKKIVGQSFLNKFLALIYLMISIMKGMGILIRKRPQAVIGVGGYISAPMIIASFFLGIKSYLCEQNVVPGMANKWLSYIAKKVFISFDKSRDYFPKSKTILSGNPVRADFFSLPLKKPGETLKILVTGGSLGAQFLNKNVPLALAKAAQTCSLSVTHQIGQKLEDSLSIYEKAGINAQVVNFIENMPQAFLAHDLIISRAGATVCAEIMASGMPAILVPYPFANGHQQHNAQALVDENAAIMVLESENFIDNLSSEIISLNQNERLLNLAKNAKSMGTPKAATLIVNLILNN